MKRILLFIMLLLIFTEAQLSKKDSIWLSHEFLSGVGFGEGKGEPGNGKYERTYSWALNKNLFR